MREEQRRDILPSKNVRKEEAMSVVEVKEGRVRFLVRVRRELSVAQSRLGLFLLSWIWVR